MKVLVACEFSGIVRDAFIRAGHDAISCDLLDSESPGPHIKGDVIPLLRERWDLVVAHPPCTFLANSGVRWLESTPGRVDKMKEAALFFRACWHANSARVCVENPIQHKYAKEAHLCGQQSQLVQPWQFGHGETKAVCLWLSGLPPLNPTSIVDGREARVHRMAPGPERQKERSRFFTGIADAMAKQWGSLDIDSKNSVLDPDARDCGQLRSTNTLRRVP